MSIIISNCMLNTIMPTDNCNLYNSARMLLFTSHREAITNQNMETKISSPSGYVYKTTHVVNVH